MSKVRWWRGPRDPFARVAVACVLLLGCLQSAVAQVDLSGSWVPRWGQDQKIRGAGPDLVTFLGMPLNETARAAALAYSPATVDGVHRQCAGWPAHYLLQGPFAFNVSRATSASGEVVGWIIGGWGDRLPITVWTDGRPAPGYGAMNTPVGFTTGHWEGGTLVTTTTHMHDGLLSRNGVPSSNREVFTMYITRRENLLTITGIVEDPLYLTEPYVLSSVLTLDPALPLNDPFNSADPSCTPEEVDASLNNGAVPHNLELPPEDTLMYATQRFGIPHAAALGGAETMYPEYIRKVAKEYKQPAAYCTDHCCGAQSATGQGNFDFAIKVLQCAAEE